MIRNLTLTLALAAAAFAQAPPRHEPKALIDFLGLSQDQISRLHTLNRDFARDAAPNREQARQKFRALRETMQANNPDPAAVGRAFLEAQQLRKQTEQSMSTARQNALNVLTAEQRAKLAELENAMKLRPAIGEAMAFHLLAPSEGGFGFEGAPGFMPFGRGPGGPGGPGGPDGAGPRPFRRQQ